MERSGVDEWRVAAGGEGKIIQEDMTGPL